MALLGWLLFVLVARFLGAASYAQFSVIWGFFFALAGLLLGLQQEVTRSVIASRLSPDGPRRPPVLYAALIQGLVVATIILVSASAWAPYLFGSVWLWVILAVVAGLIAYVVTLTVNGALAGRRAWHLYAGTITADAALRFVLVLAVCLAGGQLVGWAWAISGGALSWLFFLPKQTVRTALFARGDVGPLIFLQRSTQAMVATGCSALLIAGFPVLLRVTSDGALGASSGVVLAAIVVTRSAILLPLVAYQGVAITYFVERRNVIGSSLMRLLGVMAGGGAVASAAGFLVGPAVLRLLLGSQFDSSRVLVGLLVGTAVALAMLTLSGTALLAVNRHALASTGWLVAVIATTVCLALPLSVETRCVLGLGVGPLVGLAVHLVALARTRVASPKTF